jgi:formylglycine-generating enzyme required for sulfatase activity
MKRLLVALCLVLTLSLFGCCIPVLAGYVENWNSASLANHNWLYQYSYYAASLVPADWRASGGVAGSGYVSTSFADPWMSSYWAAQVDDGEQPVEEGQRVDFSGKTVRVAVGNADGTFLDNGCKVYFFIGEYYRTTPRKWRFFYNTAPVYVNPTGWTVYSDVATGSDDNWVLLTAQGMPAGRASDLFNRPQQYGFVLFGGSGAPQGNLGFDNFAVIPESGTEPPSITITTPTDQPTYSCTASTIDLAGNASGDYGITSVAWSNDRGGSGTCTGTTSWSATGVALQEGANIITVTATDTAGNAATDTLTVILDQQGPTVTITSPTNQSTYSVYGSSLTLTGTASDSGGVASVAWVSSSGASGGCIGTGLWLAAGVPLVDGANVITIAAADTLGNQGNDTITITKLPGTGAVSIAEAKKRANNQDALLLQKVVTYATADVFYIEEDSRACGIRVEKTGHGLVPGMRADVYGTLKTNASKERYIAASHAEHDGSGDVRPLFMNTAALGGGAWSYNSSTGAGQFGVVYCTGLNNIGLLAKTCGYYTQIDSSSFVVDDGTGLNVKCVVAPGVTLNPSWDYVTVTGVSSIYKWNSVIYPPVILVGSQACISLPGGGYSGEMVHIPAGEFLMGNSGNETYVESDELPQHPVFLSAYSIGKHEVTRGEFRLFIDAGGYADPQYWSAEGWAWKLAQNRTQPDFWDEWQDWGTGSFQQTENHPVVGVRYYEAEAFCKWAGGRLPTEAEWERAARWYDDYPRTFPWGDDWSREKCNTRYDHNAAAGGYMKNQTAPVGSYMNGANPPGCVDMAGNVWEYCSDWCSAGYYSATPTGGWINPTGPATGSCHILRGGGWANVMKFERCADRNDDSLPPSGGWQATGFRMAR